MKTKITFLVLFILFSSLKSFSQASLQTSSGTTHFINGITPVITTITASDPSADSINIYLYNQYNVVVDSSIDMTGGNSSRNWSYDMGKVDTNSYFTAEFFSSGNSISSATFTPNIKPKPQWLNIGGSYTNLIVNSDSFTLHATIPILSIINNNTVPSSYKGIGGDGFGIGNANIDFDASWNMTTGIANLSSATALSLDINSLGKNAPKPNNNFQTSTNISLDGNFNLVADASMEWNPTPYKVSKKFNAVPLVGVGAGAFSAGVGCISAEIGFQLKPKVKAQVVLGYDAISNQWGFVQVGNNATQILGKVAATASVEGKLSLLCAGGFSCLTIARGEVDATLTIGAGFRHNSFTAPLDTAFWGGRFDIHAEGEVMGYHKEGDYGPWYFPSNADTFATNFRMINSMKDDFFDLSAKTLKTTTNVTPKAWTMGVISARDSILAVAWIDDINFGSNNSNLLITNYNAYTGNFSTPVSIASNDSSIIQPSVSLLPNHNSLIAWTQMDGVFDTLQSYDNNLEKQNIWFAVFDPNSNSVIYKAQLTDASGNAPEGQPKIYWGKGNQGMITWEVGDLTAMNGTDIYYSVITENAGTYSFSAPAIISNSIGNNFSLQLAYYDSVKAIAEWISDPDMNDSTTNDIMYSEWNGSTWSSPAQRFILNNGYQVKDITMAANGSYGVEGFTYNYLNSDSTLVNGVYLGWWKNNDPIGSYDSLIVEDSTLYYQLPQAAVSTNGNASLTLQIRDVTDPNDKGLLNLFLKDLNSSNAWDNVSVTNPAGLGDLCDSTAFVWDASSAFGKLNGNGNDIGYLFTQEMDSVGNTHPGSHGQIFGNPNLNLVLRAFQVNNNSGTMSITDVQEPSTNPIYTFYQNVKSFNNDFELKQNIPNPYNNETVIPFHIGIGGKVKLEVFNILGGQIATLLNQQLEPGDYATQFNSGNLANGIYYYKLTVNNSSVTKKMVVAK